MSLHLHRAERAGTLVDALGDLLSAPLGDPFTSEVVSVPTPGVERWISQRLSLRLGTGVGADGICAGVGFPSPRRLVAAALAQAGPEVDDPWAPRRAVWPLLGVIDEVRGEPWAELLWSYLGDRTGAGGAVGGLDDARRSRRWSTARHLASLYARYAATRPSLVSAWARGEDVGPDGAALAPDRAWQAELWRRLHARIGGPDPVTRTRDATAELRRTGGASMLPGRVSVFGPTRLDPVHLDVLLALAAHRDVHLWLAHPSPVMWRAVAQASLPGTVDGAALARDDDPTARAVRHGLTGYLGRDARELQLQLRTAVAAQPDLGCTDEHHLPATAPAPASSLLALLQDDVAQDAPRATAERPLLAADDRSVSVHACHGPHRQVEVLREVLVGMLADDPTLEPRDIVVMCPDIETYAPLVAAAFGLDTEDGAAEHPGHRLRVRLADRSLRQLNPVLAVVSRVMELVDSRMTVSALLDLCAAPPVATRFRFSTDDLERLHDLIPRAGVRWGLDAAHRDRYGMAGFGQNTWAAGLDRLLLGVAMDETDARFIGTVLPVDDVDSGDVDLVGRLAEYVARLRDLVDACAAPQPLARWLEVCREVVDLLTDVAPADRWQHTHAYAELGHVQEQAGPVDPAATLSLAEVGALLAEAFRGRASRANFRTGTLTVATLLPMRAVPHRVVCLLGLDDGLFPRHVALDGDDLTGDAARVGDPDPRSEDRQLLLDAVLSAEDTLVVLYSGMDPRTGATLAPAVPVTALLDALDATARTVDGTPVRDRITVRHRLQPFDPENFVPGELGSPDGFSFDRAGLRGVRESRRPLVEPPDPYAGLTLPPPASDRAVELAELVRFFAHPARALLRQRAELVLGEPDEPPEEQIPVELGGLQRWAVGDRLLRSHLGGTSLEALGAAEWRRGTVPPLAFGRRVMAELGADVATVSGSAAALLEGPARREDLVIDLGPVRLSGSVPGLHGDTLVRVQFSRLSARHRLQSWLELLALTVARPETPWRCVAVGRSSRFALGPVPPGFAETVLADLVQLQGTGLTGLLPFSARTSYAYAVARSAPPGADLDLRPVEQAWKNDRDLVWTRFYPPGASLEQLMEERSRPEEVRGSLSEDSRFGTLARRVFHPLLSSGEG